MLRLAGCPCLAAVGAAHDFHVHRKPDACAQTQWIAEPDYFCKYGWVLTVWPP